MSKQVSNKQKRKQNKSTKQVINGVAIISRSANPPFAHGTLGTVPVSITRHLHKGFRAGKTRKLLRGGKLYNGGAVENKIVGATYTQLFPNIPGFNRLFDFLSIVGTKYIKIGSDGQVVGSTAPPPVNLAPNAPVNLAPNAPVNLSPPALAPPALAPPALAPPAIAAAPNTAVPAAPPPPPPPPPPASNAALAAAVPAALSPTAAALAPTAPTTSTVKQSNQPTQISKGATTSNTAAAAANAAVPAANVKLPPKKPRR